MAAVVSSEALISMQCLEVERQEENMMMGKIRNTLLGNVIGLLICVSQMAYAENITGLESDPFQQIEQVTGELLTVIAGHAEAYPANEQVYFAALNNLLEQHIDFNYIAKKVMGPYAKTATAEQRMGFSRKFRAGLLETYGRGLIGYGDEKENIKKLVTELSYGDEKIVLVNKAQLKPGQRRVSVKQEIQTADAVYPMEYSMALSKKTGKWKAINVVINGINMRNIFQSQFISAAQKANGDIDTVIANWSSK